METEEIKFEMVKTILGVDPLGSKCTFCLALPREQCKDKTFSKLIMPHAMRWKAELNKDKPVKKKKYMVNASVRGTKFIGRFEAENSMEAISMAENAEQNSVNLCHHCVSECEEAEVHELYAEEIQ